MKKKISITASIDSEIYYRVMDLVEMRGQHFSSVINYLLRQGIARDREVNEGERKDAV